MLEPSKKNYAISDKPLMVIENISKKFPGNDFKTVDNISLTIYQGEAFSLLGPSGCGKTTLMRMIAGFETPDEGKIIIDGKDVTNIPSYGRPVNMMFQSYALFPHMNVRDNVAFGLRQEKLSAQEIDKRVREGLMMVKMQDFAHRMPNQLSGGQQQRVALARSLAKRPKLLLLDEPLGALDQQTREHTQMELINIQNMLDTTFVIVTHDQEEAMAMSSRIGVMDKGNILQIGTPEDIYEKPNSRFVADFIGSINMFEGEVVIELSNAGFVIVHSKESKTNLRVKTHYRASIGENVWVAVRPEEMGISSIPAPPNENQIEGEIIDIAFLGHQIIYHVQLDTNKIVNISVQASARSKNDNLILGNRAFVSWYDTDGVLLTK